MTEKVKIKATLEWANLSVPNEMSGKYQVDLCNLSKEAVEAIEGIDGRKLQIRSAHAALNTLLQACGAIIAKKALVLLDNQLKRKYHNRYKFVANIHDEFLIECDEDIADDIGMWMLSLT